MNGPAVQLYDTTLRDGMQQEGMSLSVEEKVRVALELDKLGIHFIEGGFPASNPKEVEFFARMERERLINAELVAFGMTRRKGLRAEDDPGLQVLSDCHQRTVAIVGKTWGLHLSKVLHVSRDENLHMIDDSVRLLVARGKRLVYDAEHFFDAYRDDPDYAMRTLAAAADAGAAALCLCDTNGATLPAAPAEPCARWWRRFSVPVGVHFHNDGDCAVASSLMAVDAGARQVQGTVNGYGERCGNADLISIIPALVLKMGLPVISDEQLERLTETAHFVAGHRQRYALGPPALCGHSAFTHKGGLHVAAVEAAPQTFEHVDPARVGNEQRVLISELSGKGAVLRKAQRDGSAPGGRRRARRRRSSASQAAGARRATNTRRPTPRSSCSCATRSAARAALPPRELSRDRREARGRHDRGRGDHQGARGGERIIATAEGNGPVNALDNALRQAIVRKYPHLGDIELVNYKVRILDEDKGTGAVTRVLLDASDGERTLGQHRRLREHHRGELAGAGRLHRVRHAARRRGRPVTPRRRRPPASRASAALLRRRVLRSTAAVGAAAGTRSVRRLRPARPAGVRARGPRGGRSRAGRAPGPGARRADQDRGRRAELPRPRRRAGHGGQAPSRSSSSSRPRAVIGPGRGHRAAAAFATCGLRSRAGAGGRAPLPGREPAAAGRLCGRLHVRQRRHGARPARAGRPVDARQELRHVLPARPLGGAAAAAGGGSREHAGGRRRGAGRPPRRHDRLTAGAARVRQRRDDAGAWRRDPDRHAGRCRAVGIGPDGGGERRGCRQPEQPCDVNVAKQRSARSRDAAERHLTEWLAGVVAGEAADLGEIDDEFVALLAEARLLPLAARHGAVHPRVAAIERVAFANAVTTARLSDRFVAALAGSGVQSVTLRGPALGAAFWGDAALRPSTDIDLLVSPADVPAARRVLESQGLSASDFRPQWYLRRWHFHDSYACAEPRAVLEMHWNIVRPHAGQVAISALVAEAETVVWHGARLRAPSPPWHMLVCAVHAMAHYFSLRELLDIAFIARTLSSRDWQRACALARSSRLAPAMYYSVTASAERFGCAATRRAAQPATVGTP